MNRVNEWHISGAQATVDRYDQGGTSMRVSIAFTMGGDNTCKTDTRSVAKVGKSYKLWF